MFRNACTQSHTHYYFMTYFYSSLSTIVSGVESRVVFHSRQWLTDNCHEHVCIYIFARLYLVMFIEL